mgnify:CR=1 FL=1
MSELARIKQQLDAAFNGGAWHGPSVFESIDGVTAAEAGVRHVAGAHTIREIVAIYRKTALSPANLFVTHLVEAFRHYGKTG